MKVTLRFEIPDPGFDVTKKPFEAVGHAIRTLSAEIPIGQVEARFCNCDEPKLRNGSGHRDYCPVHIEYKVKHDYLKDLKNNEEFKSRMRKSIKESKEKRK